MRGWAEQGVPLKLALAGIDRTFERYYRRKAARRRPMQVSFCNDDVLEMFDDWRRALGLSGMDGAHADGSPGHGRTIGEEHGPEAGSSGTAATATSAGRPERYSRRGSLPQHLERVANRLTLLRGDARNDAAVEAALTRAVLEIDSHRQSARQARGTARATIVTRLQALEEELLSVARAGLSPDERQRLAREAADTLAPFRERMPPHAYDAAREAALTRLLREHARLPVIRYDADE